MIAAPGKKGHLSTLRWIVLASASAYLAIAVLGAAGASAAFGIKSFRTEVTRDPAGNADVQAGSHPYGIRATIHFNTVENPETETEESDGNVKDIHLELPPGLLGNPQATPQCTQDQFENTHFYVSGGCPASSQVGTVTIYAIGTEVTFPVYNLVPAPGVPAEFGFVLLIDSVRGSATIRSDGSYGLDFDLENISQALTLTGASLNFWGTPADPRHDAERACSAETTVCHDEAMPTPFLTLPTSCAVPLRTTLSVDSWGDPGRRLADGSPDPSDPAWVTQSTEPESHGQSTGTLTGCDTLAFQPRVALQGVAEEAVSATGLNAAITVDDEGLESTSGFAASPIKRLVLKMPEGFTLNPSAANGLEACTRAEYEGEGLSSPRSEGCPETSSIGQVTFTSPILGGHEVDGSVYVARQNENPTNSLLGLYVITRDPQTGLFFKLFAPVDLDSSTGQATISLNELPQLPLSELLISFWSGPRAALATPSTCGTYTATAELSPWARPATSQLSSIPLRVTRGPNGGPCPSTTSAPAFAPQVVAETSNPNAAGYTPLAMRITRTDLEPPITSFATKFPPGLLANLNGIARCSNSAIDSARTMSAAAVIASPPCPASSMIGTTQVGAGVGSVLSYLSGGVYLAGPDQGSPYSVAVIVPVRLGPFDLGTIVLRFLLHVDFDSAQISLEPDPTTSIPQIMDGVPSRIRDIRLRLDRERFLINPSSCEPFAIVTKLVSGSLSALTSGHFQATNCAGLPLAPKISLSMKNGSGHGAHPSIASSIRFNPGDSNIARAKIILPASEQLDPSHLRGLCSKARSAEGRCPKASRYGTARVFSPLLESPLQGAIYLVNAKGLLPDIVAHLEAESLSVNVVGSIGNYHGRLAITFGSLPDVPLSRFELSIPGGKRGTLVNDTDLCETRPVVKAKLKGQNGRVISREIPVRVPCRSSRPRK